MAGHSKWANIKRQLRALFAKFDGNLGETNSVSWGFTHMEISLQAHAENVMMLDDGAVIFCSVDVLGTSANYLGSAGLDVKEQHIIFEPNTTMDVADPDDVVKLLKMLDALEDNDDVQHVFHNAELSGAEVT